MAYPYVVRVKQSPAFVRFILAGAGWFKVHTHLVCIFMPGLSACRCTCL